MNSVQIINRELLEKVASLARESPRRRRNYNFHETASDACHRLLNAIEPDSYIQPHCHREITKEETLIVVRGRLGVILFDDHGAVTAAVALVPASESVGVNIPHGVYHTLVALESGSVFFEAKAGPFVPLMPDEKASWAPAEGDAQAASYLKKIKQRFA
ncbi:MAG: WbuC family cupin fold metalloprotein [Sulfuricaulis sp.]|nr:WbuC family cupin fold metalloprotein [Sulfuricaulis sp.]